MIQYLSLRDVLSLAVSFNHWLDTSVSSQCRCWHVFTRNCFSPNDDMICEVIPAFSCYQPFPVWQSMFGYPRPYPFDFLISSFHKLEALLQTITTRLTKTYLTLASIASQMSVFHVFCCHAINNHCYLYFYYSLNFPIFKYINYPWSKLQTIVCTLANLIYVDLDYWCCM